MLISWNWMSDFVDLDGIDPQEAAARLTLAGLEVAGIKQLCPPELKRVVSARITELRPHPEADKLSLCTVSDGSDELQIVCGARNMKAGDLVALAPVGTRLPNGMAIKKAKIRGIASTGMLCSAAELGLEEESAGIMILPPDLPLGEPVIDLLGIQDTILEFEITPNRGDCLSVIGVARELAAIYKRPFHLPEVKPEAAGKPVTELARIEIEDADLCPRYVGRVVENIVLGESPLWLKTRLQAAGVRAISNVVDVTNYVMLETGQPLHAFDLDLLRQRRIIVRRAGKDGKFTTLDGIERKIDPETLMICDGEGPVAIAGIMGGLNSEINDKTRNVLIESAFFVPASIRRSSRLLNLSTEASYRFERGVDPQATGRAAARAAELLQQLAQGRVADGELDICPDPTVQERAAIVFRPAQANRLLGLELGEGEVRDIFSRLRIGVAAAEDGKLTVVPPAWRFDLEREVDLIEEVARIYGYDRVPVSTPRIAVTEVLDDPETINLGCIRQLLARYGCCEAVNYSFIDEAAVAALGFPAGSRFHDFVRLQNPISTEMAVMRTTLLPGLLANLKNNLRVNVKDVRLFEIGRNFYRLEGEKQPSEELFLAGVFCGRRWCEHFSLADDKVDFFDLKGLLEELAETLRLKLTFTPGDFYACLTPGQAASLVHEDRVVGSIGRLHHRVASEVYDFEPEVFLFEIALEPLLQAAATTPVTYRGLPRYPAVYRDLAFLFDQNLPAAEVLDFIRGQHKLITEVEIFDVFQSESLPAGKKSLAFRLTFQDTNKTLTDKKVNAIIAKLIKGIEDRFQGEVR
ncbi:MAG: phenylalanine--tRNA ligase subunit beta [Deltaproteobacteria bacterium]|nr:phenylalanine--tRNA ligase subunit beta [Deltaproteobacteria bacterium]